MCQASPDAKALQTGFTGMPIPGCARDYGRPKHAIECQSAVTDMELRKV
jgi:hypothetical protein